MGKMSRDKGARGERQFCDVCRTCGYDGVHRTAQRVGKLGGAPDVQGLPGVHVEVKNVERLNVRDAMEQAMRDAAECDIPIVAHKRNNAPWLITMNALDWFELYHAWEVGREVQ